MPPERLSWDRKDFFKERKYERPTPRWRESSSSSSSHYGYFSRWGGGGGSNDFRRPPGHGKQGGWHLFPEESGHGGHVPFRSSERILEDKNCRPSISRGDGKYSRNSSRDNRGSFGGQRDWKNHPWEMSNGSPNMPGRVHDVSNDQRSVEDIVACPPTHSHPEFANPWDQLPSRYQHDDNTNIINDNNNNNSNNKMAGVNGLFTSQRGERENSLDWKPLKWTRSGSLSSRGSGFSHSSSSKSLGGADSEDGRADMQIKKASLAQSSVGDGTACVNSVPSEDMTSRKKPRLNWGEGLAKYEKKKVEGPEVNGNKDGSVISTCNGELMHLQSSNSVDKSPRVMGMSECASPATPSSVACSSPGVEEKTSSKGIIAENDVSNSYRSPSVGSQSHIEDFSFNLEDLDATTMSNLSSSLVELLQYDDSSSVDSSFMRSTVMNKLLVLKGDISKALEVTESEIDSLENELKSLKFKSGNRYPCPAASSSPFAENDAKLGCEQGATFINIPRPSPLQVSCSGAGHADKVPISNNMDEVHGGIKDDDVDSPGTATSKFVEPMTMSKGVSSLDDVKPDECSGVTDAIQTPMPTILPSTDEENIGGPACRDASMLVEIKEVESFPSDKSFAEDNLCNSILAANKKSASRASEVFDNLLPRDLCNVDFSEVCSVSLRQNDALVKDEFAMRKRFLRFKERVLIFKFKAFQKLWKEDMRLLSIRKYRAKSQKRYELSLRTMHSGPQKNRFSIRSRFSSPVGNLSVVPTTELLNFTSKLLSVSQVKHHRNALKMPALILDKKERVASRFISGNGLVEDPCAVEKERAMINPWTLEEKEVFIDKLAAFGKDFQKIASYLDHKTTADCVEFYYKNHKSDCFEKAKGSKQVKSSTNYLMTSGKNWDREMNAASLDILGAASVIAADADNVMGNHQMHSEKIYLAGIGDSKKLHVDEGDLDQVSKFDILENERETVAADVLAGICGSISSEAMSSCITTSIDPVDGCREWKSHKMNCVKKQPSTSDITQNNDEETCSDDSCGQMDPADWTDEEKAIFVRAISSYGKDFAKISRCVRTRSRDQCKVFFSKARKCLGLDSMHPALGCVGTPMSDDANGGESDTEDGCAPETCSIICSDRLGSMMDEGVPLHDTGMRQEESGAVEKKNLSTGFDRYEKSNVDDLVHQSSLMRLEISNESVSSEAEREKRIVGSLLVGNVVHPGSPSPVSDIEVKAMEEVSVKGNGDLVKGMELAVPENRLNGQMQNSNATSNASHLPSDMGSSSNDSLGVENLHHVSVEFHSVERSHIVSLQQENKLTTSALLPDSSVIKCEKVNKPDRLSSQFEILENRDEKSQNFGGTDGHFQQFPGQSFINCGKSQPIHGGYPLQIQTKREMNEDISSMSRSEVQSLSTSERNGAIQFVAQDCYLQKCNNSKAQELPLLLPHTDNDHSRDHSWSLSDVGKPCRNGDVKLFGKILSNPSSSQKSNPGIRENGEQGINGPKPCNKSSTLKFTGHQSTDGSTSVLKFDRNNYPGLENVPVKSYGFWDGNKIQTGFSSIPPEYFLAKYPAAFSNFHMSTSKMEQQALQAAVKCNDGNLNSVSVLSPREAGGSNGAVDYQMYRSHDGSKLQQFSVEVKQRQDMLSEVQRLNGFEGMSSIHQQGRGMVGMNVVVGGVSDAVAALQMHYAKTEQQLGGQKGTMREDESWRSKGDVGR